MRKLTTEEYNTLKKFEREMNLAVTDVAAGMTQNDAKTVFGIYNDVMGTHDTGYNCPSCRLRVLKKLHELYYDKMKCMEKSAKRAETLRLKKEEKENENGTEVHD